MEARAARSTQWILDGTNMDDLGDDRPGIKAAREWGVRSPLVEAALTKADVREVAKALGLSAWDKPAAACLSSRVPRGDAHHRRETAPRRAGRGHLARRRLPPGPRPGSWRYRQDRDRAGRVRTELTSRPVRASISAAPEAGRLSLRLLDLEGYRQGGVRLPERALGLRPAPRSSAFWKCLRDAACGDGRS